MVTGCFLTEAIALTCSIKISKFSKVRDWGPSHLAWSGLGCTSISNPWAPAATDARATGVTKYHFPVLWLGSATMGKWLSRLITGTAATSNVNRVKVSNPRTPRSQRITCSLPPAITYSAASSHSSYEAASPRLTITGFPIRPT